jgi:tripartite-type tricarboxylate transporter receptor subunit TctC
MKISWVLGAAALAAVCTAPAFAQNYPTKPVRLILSYPPGGATDTIGRLMAKALSDAWGVNVIADNRPGAAGSIGTSLCVKSPPDGYTMCMVAPAQAMASRISSTVPFDSLKDFSHVSLIATMPMLLLVHPSLPVKNVRELVALAKRKPGALSYASSGGGASHHLAMELLKQRTGTDIVLVTYKGGGAQITDQLAGRVELAFNLAVGVLPYVQQGRLRAIAVSTKDRFPMLPDVPTVAEQGIEGYDMSSWQGLSMPAGVPAEIVRRVSAEVAKAVKTPETRDRLLAIGAVAVGSTPEAFDAFFKSESDMMYKIGRAAGLKGD